MASQVDGFVPHLGMEFQTIDDAWSFSREYGGKNGFGVRKGYGAKSKKDDTFTSYLFVCQCEGTRGSDKRDYLTKNPRAKTRFDCKSRLQIKFGRGSKKYKVIHFDPEHNHPLQKPEACYLLPSQRKVPQTTHIDIYLADSSRIPPKQAHELYSKQAGGIRGIGYTEVDHKNCLRDMRKKAMEYGSAIAIMKYFEKRALEDPHFQYFEDTTENQEVANIVWMNAKMIADYVRFGDVVIFDTTFGTNEENWALGVFVGFNHFKRIVIFGAALMCNQTTESFEWVFTKFLEAHGGKRPITFFTDQDRAMGAALKLIMPDTKHGLCTWHISQNSQKHLMRYNKNGMNITGEFFYCMFKFEEKDEFEGAFKELMEKVDDKTKAWLKFMYDNKEKWTYCFMKDAYTLGIRSTQGSESINSILKDYLNCKLNIDRFMEQFDEVLDKKLEKEVKADFEMKRALPKIKLNVPILRQAGELYTPKLFELFQAQFELSGFGSVE